MYRRCRYCEYILGGVGTAEALVPPEPPLTRYKRELAVAAEQAEAAAYGGGQVRVCAQWGGNWGKVKGDGAEWHADGPAGQPLCCCADCAHVQAC